MRFVTVFAVGLDIIGCVAIDPDVDADTKWICASEFVCKFANCICCPAGNCFCSCVSICCVGLMIKFG